MTIVYDLPTAGILRPSSAPRWGNCAGSFALEARYPEEEDSPQAREGTAAHYYATEAVQGRVWPVGTLAPNGHPIDDEMVECGAYFIEAVARYCGAGVKLTVEQPVTAHGLIHPENEGTPDAAIVDYANHTVTIPDYKYGHLYVDPFQNLQLVDYLAGVVEREELTFEDFKGWRCRFVVVQPRNFHSSGPIRVWECLGWEAWKLFDKLAAAALEAKKPNAPTVTGAWCRDCRGRWACPTFLASGDMALDMAGQAVAMEMSGSALGLKLRHIARGIKRLEALRTGLEEVALAAMARGENVAHWTKEYGAGREKWATPLPEVFALGDMMGVDLRKEAAITPSQARKAGIDAAVIAGYAEIPRGAAKLVPVDDNAAAKAFG